ncbi:MAG TPA: HEAT repeat domain-containing protein [Candidatus Bathyarchaeia archaeon]|nr:HEAT repeat domain-containing protein [Candidatus Bathyarchaeia archaeon]
MAYAISILIIEFFLIFSSVFLIVVKITSVYRKRKINKLKENKDINKLTKLAKKDISFFDSIIALGTINSTESRYALITLLQYNRIYAIRRITAIVLGELKAIEAIDAIKQCLGKDNDNKTKFTLAYTLSRLEEKKGEGYDILKKMRDLGELELVHLRTFNDFTNYLQVKELYNELNEIISLSNQNKDKIGEKEIINLIDNIKLKLTKFTDSFLGYTENISDLDIASNFLKKTIKQFEESPPSVDKLDSLSKMTSVTNSLIEIEKARKAKESWLSKNGAVIFIAALTTVANILAIVLPLIFSK